MIIDEETGEVIEEDKTLVKKEMNALITDELLDQLVQMKYFEEQVEIWKFKHKEKIKEIFKKYGIKSFKNDYIELTYVAPNHRQNLDNKKAKEYFNQLGILKDFEKQQDVAESLRIRLKEGNN